MKTNPKLVTWLPVCLFLSCSTFSNAQTLIHHTTNWFGPNANPVPEFTAAIIPASTSFTARAEYSFGHGDNTETLHISAEVPLIREKVSVKVWIPALEHYRVTEELASKRIMLDGTSGFASGDLYLQTRILLLKETDRRPTIVLNSTLKTSPGSGFKNRRYFNTAGYYFDTEIGKSFRISSRHLSEIRIGGDVGFFSWDVQTPGNNVQDDAIMYGGKVILKNQKWSWENTLAGYYGWLRRIPEYGNKPLVYASRINFHGAGKVFFVQYQHGIQHFPYEQVLAGATFNFKSLTPNFFR